MAVVPFHQFFPQLAKDECRSAILQSGPESQMERSGLPDGTYAFTEAYCADPDCDCRRVIFRVFHPESQAVLAVISYSFDPEAEIPGPFLDPLNPQSEYAELILDLASSTVLRDPHYVARLERHYQMVKAAVRQRPPKATEAQPWWKRKRRKPKKGQSKRRR